ncbi:hypothetical protein NQ318_020519 [Aromia moschata]|uniref:Uncharacterized protein n=1 Tax=Aromia moschata TaxID=1265417 RepID=A0AAV8Z2A8_9CUCU|nr:hypothetical protein NQ318_020519 [Aromia moschata]
MASGRSRAKRDVKRPNTIPRSDEKENISKLICEDRRLSTRGLAEITGIDKECIRQILHDSCNMRKVCAKMAPKLLTPEQKESRINICADILNNIETSLGLFDMVITCDNKFRKCGSG